MVQTVNVNLPTKDNYEYVKCVLVGDTGVGKTCLTCAWSVGNQYKLESLVKSHVSTVFAVDHFMKDRNVYNRSWCNVDGLPVSLHLWDTFGSHGKDRGFSYKGADVILLCFSIAKPSSLDSILKFWMTEIRSKCSSTPVVLVGTQADMRYNCTDDFYKNMEKGLVYKMVKPEDIILPDKGRAVAKQIGAPYYETSVLTHYGIDSVFFNVIRAAMMERRKIKFWSAQLRRIKHPLIQTPMEWPKRPFPEVKVPESNINDELSDILSRQNTGDMIINVNQVCFRAHRVILSSSCQLMEDILMADYSSHGSTENSSTNDTSSLNGHCHELKYPGFEKIEYKQCEDPFNNMHGKMITVLSLSNDISPLALQYILEYWYSGKAKEDYKVLPEVRKAAELLKLSDLLLQISNLESNDYYLNCELHKQFCDSRCERIKRIAIWKGAFTDVEFSLDDGTVTAHKPLLMARCDMMAAMFTDNFREASSSMVPLPGITVDVFKVVQEFLYTGSVTNILEVDCLSLIEAANRLCLPRFVALIEDAIVKQFMIWEDQKLYILEDVILWIEPSHLHNANQLSQWCLEYVCQHYSAAKKNHYKYMLGLGKDNIAYVEKNIWPPLWYSNECDWYTKIVLEDNKKKLVQQQAQFSRMQGCAPCLCFRRNNRFMFEDGERIQR